MLKEMDWYEIFNFDGHFISIHSNDCGMINLSTYINLLTTVYVKKNKLGKHILSHSITILFHSITILSHSITILSHFITADRAEDYVI